MQFLEVNVRLLESVSRAYGVNLTGEYGQLPCAVLLEDGVEYCRFPTKDYQKNSKNMELHYREKELMRYFDLDKRFLATRDIGLEKKKAAT